MTFIKTKNFHPPLPRAGKITPFRRAEEPTIFLILAPEWINDAWVFQPARNVHIVVASSRYPLLSDPSWRGNGKGESRAGGERKHLENSKSTDRAREGR